MIQFWKTWGNGPLTYPTLKGVDQKIYFSRRKSGVKNKGGAIARRESPGDLYAGKKCITWTRKTGPVICSAIARLNGRKVERGFYWRSPLENMLPARPIEYGADE